MSNVNAPNGFQYYGRQDGGSPTEGLTRRFVSSGDTSLAWLWRSRHLHYGGLCHGIDRRHDPDRRYLLRLRLCFNHTSEKGVAELLGRLRRQRRCVGSY